MNKEYKEKAYRAIRLGRVTAKIPILILLMGLTGTGKSYVAHHLNQQYGFTVLSGENITHAIFGREKCTAEEYKEAYQVLHSYVTDFISEGYNVVVDATNGKLAHRQLIYNAVENYTCKKIVIQLTIDDQTALQRIAGRGVDSSDPLNVKSDISLSTYESFKLAVEDPLSTENSYRIVSNQTVTQLIDKVIEPLFKVK